MRDKMKCHKNKQVRPGFMPALLRLLLASLPFEGAKVYRALRESYYSNPLGDRGATHCTLLSCNWSKQKKLGVVFMQLMCQLYEMRISRYDTHHKIEHIVTI